MSALRFVFESLFEFTTHRLESDMPLFQTKEFGARTPGTKPQVSPYGPHYRMHPELSRPILGVVTSTLAVPTAYFIGPLTLAAMNYAVIENDVPDHEKNNFWLGFASAVGGTFGGNYSGLV